MAIIKKNHAQPNHPTPTEGTAGPAQSTINKPPAWSEENVEQGLVPDRRQGDRRSDRRRDYRRIEDKELVTRAQQEAVHIKQRAREEGLQQGLEQVQGELAELRQQLEALLVSREDALKSVAQDVAPLAVAVAERILKTEVACDNELVIALVHDTIQKIGRKTKSVLIKVNTDDVALVKRHMKQHPPEGLEAEIIVIEDPVVDRGSCILETNSGLIDASFSTRLEILKKLFGRLKPSQQDDNPALDWLTEDASDSNDDPQGGLF